MAKLVYDCRGRVSEEIQLHTRERFHIEDLHATLNKQTPTRTDKEWHKDNVAQQKAYRENNAEHIKQYKKDNAETIRAKQKAYKSEKIECPHCNKMFNRGSMTKHIRRKHTE